MVKGYKTVNIKEELIEKIRNYEENKKEIEQNRFNLAGFVSRVLLEYMNKEKTDKEQKKEGLTLEQIKNAVKEVYDETFWARQRKLLKEKDKFISFDDIGNVITTDTNAGITIEDLKQALLGLENDIDMKIRDMLNEVMNKL